MDRYGTQRVISLLRQLTEAGGFWRADCTWVSLHRIQFVGACNPPTDAGRVPLSLRFLRCAPRPPSCPLASPPIPLACVP